MKQTIATLNAALILLGLGGGTATAALEAPPSEVTSHHELVAAVSATNIERDITKLVSFGTRHTLSDTTSETTGIGAARRWVKAEFERISAQCGGCLEVFYVSDVVEGRRLPVPTEVVNVIAIQRGTLDTDRYVLMAGDIDSRVSDGMDATSASHGANDNASGVTVVWELINLIQTRPASDESRRSLLVVFFGGEEVGLQGSGYFVAHPPLDLARVDAMINFDTVGQLTDNRLYVSGIGTAEALPALVQAANTDGLDLSLGQGGWSGSDHMSFNTREVPVLFVFGGPYVQYNRPADTWDSLSPASLVKVAAYSDRLLDLLRATPEPLTWVMVAEKKLREGETEGANRDTWFGSLPDFTEDIKGYKLAGVFDNSPAARSGLQKGDVLVRMAGQDIIDLPSFTRVLRSHAPGDLVEVEILRAGNPLRFTVVMGNRSERQ